MPASIIAEVISISSSRGAPAAADFFAEAVKRIRAEWCEVWLDPYADGAFRNGWVSGRYIRPA